MNKLRRKQIQAAIDRLSEVKINIKKDCDKEIVANDLENICSNVEYILSDEEYYMDNIPENMQGGYRYEAAEEACDNLCDAIDDIVDALRDIDNKTEALNCIDEAVNHLYVAM